MRYGTTLVLAMALSFLVASTALATTYEIVFSLKTQEYYSSLDYIVDYSAADGEFEVCVRPTAL